SITAGSTLLISSATLVGLASVPGWLAASLATLGAGFLGVFVLVSARARAPMIDLRMIVELRFLRSGVAAFSQMFCLGAVVVAVPLYVTGPMGRDAAETGGLVLVLPAMMALGAPAVGWLCGRASPRVVLRSGLVTLATAEVLLGCYLGGHGASIAILLAVLAVTGLGIALIQTPAATGATRAPAGRSGAVLGLYSLLRFAGSALGTAWVAIAYPHGNLLLLFGGCAVLAAVGLAVSFAGANPQVVSPNHNSPAARGQRGAAPLRGTRTRAVRCRRRR
ncbi:MAG: MFS transporter, partial [Sciscionella sp.]